MRYDLTTDMLELEEYRTREAQLPEDGLAKKLDVSIVIPLLNEVDSLDELYAQLKAVMDGLHRSVELILVDDGSTDGTYEKLEEISSSDRRVRVIQLRRNFGQTAAFSAGFDLARGEVIVTMDGDLQNDAADIPLLLDKIAEGYDVVSGWRIRRQDKLLTRKLPSRLANALISWVTGVKLHDYGCSLKAYRWEVIKNIRLYGEMHRFIPALAKWIGIRVAEVPVSHYSRRYGRSKYGLRRTIKVVLDLMTVKFLLDYSTRPIQIFGLLGMISLGSGTLIGLFLSYQKLVFRVGLRDRPLLLLAVLLVVLGVQLITMGLLGEMVVRTYHETQNKPIYLIRRILEHRENPERN